MHKAELLQTSIKLQEMNIEEKSLNSGSSLGLNQLQFLQDVGVPCGDLSCRVPADW